MWLLVERRIVNGGGERGLLCFETLNLLRQHLEFALILVGQLDLLCRWLLGRRGLGYRCGGRRLLAL